MKKRNKEVNQKPEPIAIKIPLIPRDINFDDEDGSIKYKTFESGETSINEIISNPDTDFKSGRGRKSGSGTLPPSHIVGLVDDQIDNPDKDFFIDKTTGEEAKELTGRGKTGAFNILAGELEEVGKPLSPKNIKKQYYKAKNELRPSWKPLEESEIDGIFKERAKEIESIAETITADAGISCKPCLQHIKSIDELYERMVKCLPALYRTNICPDIIEKFGKDEAREFSTRYYRALVDYFKDFYSKTKTKMPEKIAKAIKEWRDFGTPARI